LPEVSLEAHAPGDLEGRDDAALDGLAALSGTFARQPVFPAGAVEVSRELVVLAGLQFYQQLIGCLAHFG
jgi:hypothetical protein